MEPTGKVVMLLSYQGNGLSKSERLGMKGSVRSTATERMSLMKFFQQQKFVHDSGILPFLQSRRARLQAVFEYGFYLLKLCAGITWR